ncbi:MAG: hypothetical protein BWZ10_00945 [candidate division BRC1 bacterium ADurb.BinA364]|nr:MAG: hypothetical protein BWZ10_00945 [candidate division BRC1 bacterium ADurb.BinA364]
MSSFIFNSRRLPWGVVWCAVFILAAELGFRLAPASFFIVMDQHDYATDDTLDYSAVNLAIQSLPAPDAVVLGSSRAREGVHCPTLVEALRRELGRPLEIRNYALAAGRIDVCLALLDRLIVEDKLPKTLIVALDASEFRDVVPPPHRFRVVSLRSLPAEIERNSWPGEKDVTPVLGNSLPLRMALARETLRYRLVQRGDFRLADALARNAALGGETAWARLHGESDTPPSLAIRAIPGVRLRQSANAFQANEAKLARLGELVEQALNRDARVFLCEIPVSPPLRENYSRVESAEAVLRAAMHALAKTNGVAAWTAEEAQAQFGLEDYFDQSHLNARGARRFTAMIAPAIANLLRPMPRPAAETHQTQ